MVNRTWTKQGEVGWRGKCGYERETNKRTRAERNQIMFDSMNVKKRSVNNRRKEILAYVCSLKVFSLLFPWIFLSQKRLNWNEKKRSNEWDEYLSRADSQWRRKRNGFYFAIYFHSLQKFKPFVRGWNIRVLEGTEKGIQLKRNLRKKMNTSRIDYQNICSTLSHLCHDENIFQKIRRCCLFVCCADSISHQKFKWNWNLHRKFRFNEGQENIFECNWQSCLSVKCRLPILSLIKEISCFSDSSRWAA